MAIGLSSEELAPVFFSAFLSRIAELKGRGQAAEHGEDPQFVQIVETVNAIAREQFPKLDSNTAELLGLFMGVFGYAFSLALGDMIAANNRALAQAVPHIEQG